MSTDRISNLLSAVKNASMAGNTCLETVYFRQGKEILDILKDHGLVKDIKLFKQEGSGFKGIHIDLTEQDGVVRKLELERLSKPGRRVYGQYENFLRVKAGLGVLVVSTSRGVMSGEQAKKKKLGGELICKGYFN